MIKLIATDLDGTFLDQNKMFDYGFLSQFHKMQEKHITFVLASGNQYMHLYKRFSPMSDDLYFIADNGSYIAKGRHCIRYDTLSPDELKQVLAALKREPQLFVILSGIKATHLLKTQQRYEKVAALYYENLTYHDSFDEVDDAITKISIFDPIADIHAHEDTIRRLLPSGLSAVTAGNEWLDIQHLSVNKGAGIRTLQRLLNITPDECAAFGDAMNDYTLLNSVRYSYAMKNADPRIKAIARHVLPWTNDEQGVIRQIIRILNHPEDY